VPNLPEDRPLSPQEAALTRWLLEHGGPEAAAHLAELPQARVVGRCPCGCASVNFAIDGRVAPPGAGLQVLSDHVWRDGEGMLAGLFAFACAGRLAGIEVYTLDPDAAIDRLPSPDVLEPFKSGPDG
jgi:hypothetical protein